MADGVKTYLGRTNRTPPVPDNKLEFYIPTTAVGEGALRDTFESLKSRGIKVEKEGKPFKYEGETLQQYTATLSREQKFGGRTSYGINEKALTDFTQALNTFDRTNINALGKSGLVMTEDEQRDYKTLNEKYVKEQTLSVTISDKVNSESFNEFNNQLRASRGQGVNISQRVAENTKITITDPNPVDLTARAEMPRLLNSLARLKAQHPDGVQFDNKAFASLQKEYGAVVTDNNLIFSVPQSKAPQMDQALKDAGISSFQAQAETVGGREKYTVTVSNVENNGYTTDKKQLEALVNTIGKEGRALGIKMESKQEQADLKTVGDFVNAPLTPDAVGKDSGSLPPR